MLFLKATFVVITISSLVSFLLTANTNCIRNSHYTTCMGPKNMSCTNLEYMVPVDIVKPECSEGCACNDGFIYEPYSGRCVSPISCPNGVGKCGANEEFTFCVICGEHRTTCHNYGKVGTRTCRPGCVSGCSCKDGFIYDERRRRCVRPMDCSCGQKEYYKICSARSPSNCEVGCTCRKGFRRAGNHSNAMCVAY